MQILKAESADMKRFQLLTVKDEIIILNVTNVNNCLKKKLKYVIVYKQI